jgi:hypothetical protein
MDLEYRLEFNLRDSAGVDYREFHVYQEGHDGIIDISVDVVSVEFLVKDDGYVKLWFTDVINNNVSKPYESIIFFAGETKRAVFPGEYGDIILTLVREV